MAQEISLKSLLVPSKNIDVEFPGCPDFILSLGFMSRETLIGIRKRSTKTILKGRQTKEEFDEELFLQLYCEAAIRGWKGFKFKYVQALVPVDVSKFDPDDELGYTKENALMIMQNSSEFDNFISEHVNDLGNFNKSN